MAKAKTTIKKITQNAWECTKIFKTGEIEKRIVKDPIDIWSIGNTGVRNPWRIPGGYKVYVESNQVGKIRTAQEQKLFKEKLLLAGEIGGDPKKDADASITRKYRLMFNKYGFAYPEVLKKDGFSQKEIGKIDDITPAGWAFYHANTIQAQQECFLRGLVVQMEPLGERETYSPLRWVLKIMFDLFERTGDYKINYIEFAVCVQTSSPKYELETVVNKILEIRGRRKKYINKKKFDRDLIHNAWKHYFKEEKNFHEYADMNLRYLSASGILKRSGRGITVMPEYKSLAYELTKNVISDATLKERYKLLCQGAPLPTDNTEIAKKVLEDLINELEMYNIKYEIPDITLDNSKNINIVRSNLKQNIDHYKEEKYAQNQRECWYEIYEYMKLLISNNGKSKELGEDYIINVPKAEAAAYLEWILWRAFLAIDHIVNKPYDARGFNVDQDYLPIGTAPGGKPDMIFEFDDYVIVVEVTLSTNSRQEAMEGEPVRRHVADLVQKYKKPVYGLFVANKIDSNTAETFNERIESLELNKLLNQIIDKEKTIKTNIRTNQYTAVIFQKERNNPYTSHFYIAQELEPYLGSLELNFFISKYNEMSNKSGKKVSIYALNYGLCMDENLRWGKPKGNEYRTYFIESPFNFTPVIKNFLSENKKIYCENCMHEFSEEEYNLMKKYGGTCLKCGCKNSIQEKRVLSDEERSEIEEIEKKDNLLEREQYQLLKLLQYSRKDKTATELAQELDVSWQKIGWIAKKIEEDYCYLKKEPRKGKMYYVLSDLGREYLDSITP